MTQFIITDKRERPITSKRTRKPFFYSSERVALIAAKVVSKHRRKPIDVWEWEDFNKQVDPNLHLTLADRGE